MIVQPLPVAGIWGEDLGHFTHSVMLDFERMCAVCDHFCSKTKSGKGLEVFAGEHSC